MSSSNVKITWDTKSFDNGVTKAMSLVTDGTAKGVGMAANELLRLSLREVPIDTGHLQSTGKKSQKDLEATVSYNTPYAVKVHEHPEYKFGNGRKGKYLEDPFKRNETLFVNLIRDGVKGGIK